jgi:phosphoglycerate dehydrogenase-like enzyme
MAKPKVILDPTFRPMDQLFSPGDKARLYSLADIIWGRNDEMPPAEMARVAGEVEGIIGGWWRYGEVKDYPRLKAFIEVGGTHPAPDSFDYAAAFARGVKVLSCAPGFGPAVAEMALALTLACSRGVVATDRRFRDGTEKWLFEETADTFTLYGKNVGFIGFGGLARSLKPLLEPFGARFLVHDPWLPEAAVRERGGEPCGLEELLGKADVVYVLAIPSPGNKGLLNRERLALIRPGAVLVLISRSHLVDFDSLTELVGQGRFRAGIDVFPSEPLPKDHPIRKVPGAVLSSHKAGAMAEAMRTIGKWTVDDLEAVLGGREPAHMQVATREFMAHFGKGAER